MRGIILFVLYFITAKYGLTFDAVSGFATLIWAPTGISLAALYLFGFRLWPAIFLAAFLVNLTTGAPPFVAIGMGGGNTLEALIGAFFLKRFTTVETFLDYLKDVIALLFFAAFLSTAVSATIGVTSLYLGGIVSASSFAQTWQAWWMGDMLGALIIAPVVITWGKKFSLQPFKSTSIIIELCLLVITIITVNAVLFLNLFGKITSSPIAYLAFPPLLWASLRFGKQIVTASIVLTATVAIIGTVKGMGPFTIELHLSENLEYLQVFIGIMSVTMLSLSAVVSERKKAREELETINAHLDQKVRERTRELEESQERLQVAINSSPVVFFAFDKHGVVTISEGKGLEGLGLKPGQLVGQSVFDVYKGSPGLADVKRALKGEEFTAPVQLVGNRYLRSYFQPTRDKNNRVTGATGITIDVTEQVEIEEARKEQLRHETELETKERDFVSVASHQLLTPLSLVSGYISMLISGKLGKIDKDAKNYLEESFKGTERMSALVKELLATSRIESGNIKIQKSNFDLSLLVKGVAEDLKSKLEEKGLTLNLPKAEKVIVFVDEEQIRQVLTNVLENAIKYTEKGSITIDLNSKEEIGQVTISDTGIGIDKGALPHIFEKFFKSENWVSKQSQSHGLGLYISKLLLEKMDGTITAESKKGKGSVFTINLPLAKSNG